MALTAASPTGAKRAWSLGIHKVQLMDFSVANADTSGTIMFDGLTSIDAVHISGIVQTSAPTFSGNVVTVAFVDPAATRYGQAIAFGK